MLIWFCNGNIIAFIDCAVHLTYLLSCICMSSFSSVLHHRIRSLSFLFTHWIVRVRAECLCDHWAIRAHKVIAKSTLTPRPSSSFDLTNTNFYLINMSTAECCLQPWTSNQENMLVCVNGFFKGVSNLFRTLTSRIFISRNATVFHVCGAKGK